MHCILKRALSTRHYYMITRSKSASVKYEIFHDKRKQIFSMDIEGQKAQVDYEKKGRTYDLLHSFIPENLRGQGYGNILATNVFNYIADHDLRMRITCEFLQKCYYENRDKYEDFVVE